MAKALSFYTLMLAVIAFGFVGLFAYVAAFEPNTLEGAVCLTGSYGLIGFGFIGAVYSALSFGFPNRFPL